MSCIIDSNKAFVADAEACDCDCDRSRRLLRRASSVHHGTRTIQLTSLRVALNMSSLRICYCSQCPARALYSVHVGPAPGTPAYTPQDAGPCGGSVARRVASDARALAYPLHISGAGEGAGGAKGARRETRRAIMRYAAAQEVAASPCEPRVKLQHGRTARNGAVAAAAAVVVDGRVPLADAPRLALSLKGSGKRAVLDFDF